MKEQTVRWDCGIRAVKKLIDGSSLTLAINCLNKNIQLKNGSLFFNSRKGLRKLLSYCKEPYMFNQCHLLNRSWWDSNLFIRVESQLTARQFVYCTCIIWAIALGRLENTLPRILDSGRKSMSWQPTAPSTLNIDIFLFQPLGKAGRNICTGRRPISTERTGKYFCSSC